MFEMAKSIPFEVFIFSSTTLAPHSKMQRGKARPKTSKSTSSRNPKNHRSLENLWIGTTTPPQMIRPSGVVYTIVQERQEDRQTQSATTVTNGAYVFQLSDLDQYNSFTNVFDQYRFDEVEVTFRPMFTANPLGALSSVIIPQLYTAIDYDDATNPGTSLSYLRQYNNCVVSMYETVVRRFRPHFALGAYTGSFNGYENEQHKWIDSSSSNVQHYGIKLQIEAGATGQTALQSWLVNFRYKISFRNVH
jgi:hypothetical protein